MFIYQVNQREDKFQKLADTFGSCSFVSACTPSVTNKSVLRSVLKSWMTWNFKNAFSIVIKRENTTRPNVKEKLKKDEKKER